MVAANVGFHQDRKTLEQLCVNVGRLRRLRALLMWVNLLTPLSGSFWTLGRTTPVALLLPRCPGWRQRLLSLSAQAYREHTAIVSCNFNGLVRGGKLCTCSTQAHHVGSCSCCLLMRACTSWLSA